MMNIGIELPNIAASAYEDVHVWSALLTYVQLEQPPPPPSHRSTPLRVALSPQKGI